MDKPFTKFWWCKRDTQRAIEGRLGLRNLTTSVEYCVSFKSGMCLEDGKPCAALFGRVIWRVPKELVGK